MLEHLAPNGSMLTCNDVLCKAILTYLRKEELHPCLSFIVGAWAGGHLGFHQWCHLGLDLILGYLIVETRL